MTEQQQVYPTWQSVFINLINDSAAKYLEHNYIESWRTLKVLREWLPQVCYDATNAIYEKTNRELNSIKPIGYSITTAHYNFKRKINDYLQKQMLIVSGQVRRSLEKHGYLSREAGAQPKISATAKIGETRQ